jgi:seryl-tRNA(Sec) selenium transferase
VSQERGIGRVMKASKEAVVGVLAALEARHELDVSAWARAQADKVERFAERVGVLPGIEAGAWPDPTGLPFPRARISVDPTVAGMDAGALAAALRAGSPSVWVMTDQQEAGVLVLELVPLTDPELDAIVDRLAELLPG